MARTQQEALRINQQLIFNNQRLKKELIYLHLSELGLIAFLIPTLLCGRNDLFEPAAGFGLAALGCFAWSVVELGRMVRLAQENHQLAKMSPDSIQQILSPLTQALDHETKQAVALDQGKLTPLQPLLQDQSGQEPASLTIAPNTDDFFLLEIIQQRTKALRFTAKQLLDPSIKSLSSSSDQYRIKLLNGLADILTNHPVSAGLPLTQNELGYLMNVVNLGAITERAPETMVEYLQLIARLLESYVFDQRIDLGSQVSMDEMLSQAVRAERHTGGLVSPPVSQFREVQAKIKEEENRVALTGDWAIELIKSALALGNNRAPEVREAFWSRYSQLKEFLIAEKKRLELFQGEEKQEDQAIVNTLMKILELASIENYTDSITLSGLKKLFHELAGKRRIAPRDIIEEFTKSGHGSIKIISAPDLPMIRVWAENSAFADALACAAAICHPHIPQMEIYISSDGRIASSRSIDIPTEVLYSQRLIMRNPQFITNQFFHEQEETRKLSSNLNQSPFLPT